MTDVTIVGAGPAGLTAAIYSFRAGMKVNILESTMYGGQLGNTAEIENYPAVQKISGWQLAQNIYEQVVAQGISITFDTVKSISLEKNLKIVNTESGQYKTRTVIIANGAKRKKLECPGEKEFLGRGVSYCATCDGAFFKDKTVAVVGGGNTAIEDVLFLSNVCKKVYIVHRRDEFRGEKFLVKALDLRKNVETLFSHTIQKINGSSKVESVTLLDVKTNKEKKINVSGVFIAIGMQPDNKIFSDILVLDKEGYIVASEDCRTNIEGIYAAGDTRTKPLRQIVTATSDGAVAAVQAANTVNTLYNKS